MLKKIALAVAMLLAAAPSQAQQGEVRIPEDIKEELGQDYTNYLRSPATQTTGSCIFGTRIENTFYITGRQSLRDCDVGTAIGIVVYMPSQPASAEPAMRLLSCSWLEAFVTARDDPQPIVTLLYGLKTNGDARSASCFLIAEEQSG